MLWNYVEVDYTFLVGKSNPTIHLIFCDLDGYMAFKIVDHNVCCAWMVATFENMFGIACIHQTQ